MSASPALAFCARSSVRTAASHSAGVLGFFSRACRGAAQHNLNGHGFV